MGLMREHLLEPKTVLTSEPLRNNICANAFDIRRKDATVSYVMVPGTEHVSGPEMAPMKEPLIKIYLCGGMCNVKIVQNNFIHDGAKDGAIEGANDGANEGATLFEELSNRSK